MNPTDFDLNIDEFNKSNPNYFLKKINGELKAVENTDKKIEIERKGLIKKLERSGIPLRYQLMDLKDLKVDKGILEQANLYVNNFKPKSFYNIYLEGKQTVGKTSIACCMAKELVYKGFSCQFYYAGELSNILRDYHSYGKLSEEAKVKLDNLMKKDFLVLDDMFDINKDIVYKSTNLAGQWDVFLRKVLDSGMNMIVTSNTLLKNINEEYGKSIQELMDRNFHLKVNFKESIKDAIITKGKNNLINQMQ